jgi:ubiquinone/menaquinone biosynthesis C-methylase UbiE
MIDFRAQFGRPEGWLGWLLGRVMAIRNKERSLWVLSQLQLRSTDRVLEIGFGSGVDIKRASERVKEGFVVGLDHSEIMVDQAAHRNKAGIRSGRVGLTQGMASDLPFASGSFDIVFSINVAQFWENPVKVAGEIHRVLKPGGRVALAVQPRNRCTGEQSARHAGDMLGQALTVVGFTSLSLNYLPMKPVSVVCLLATK